MKEKTCHVLYVKNSTIEDCVLVSVEDGFVVIKHEIDMEEV